MLVKGAGLRMVLRIAVSGVMLVLLVPRLKLSALLPQGQRAGTVGWIVVGLAVTLVGLVLSAWRWQRVLSVLQVRSGLANLMSHYLAGQFVGNFLPSTIGGDVLRVSRLSGTAPGTVSFASVVIERLTGWVVLPLITLAAFLVQPSLLHLGLPSRIALGVSMGTLVLLCGLVAMAGSRSLAGRFAANENWTRFIGAVHLGVDGFRRRPGDAAGVLAVATAYQLSTVATVWIATRALALDLPLLAIVAFAPVVSMAQVLPISLNGLGVREGALVLFLGPFGVAAGEAITVGLLVYFMTLGVSLLGAPAFAVGRKARPLAV